MSAYTTISITRSTAIKLYLQEKFPGQSPDKVLEEFLDDFLRERLYNAFVVDDDAPNDDHLVT